MLLNFHDDNSNDLNIFFNAVAIDVYAINHS